MEEVGEVEEVVEAEVVEAEEDHGFLLHQEAPLHLVAPPTLPQEVPHHHRVVTPHQVDLTVGDHQHSTPLHLETTGLLQRQEDLQS